MKKEKVISVALRLSESTCKRADRIAQRWGSPEERRTRAQILRMAISEGLNRFEDSERTRNRKNSPAHIANRHDTILEEQWRVQVVPVTGRLPNTVYEGPRFLTLEKAREYYVELDVSPGQRKELQHRGAGKSRYEVIGYKDQE